MSKKFGKLPPPPAAHEEAGEELFASCSFADLGLHSTLCAHLQDKMSFQAPTRIQAQAIPVAISGQHMLVKAATGTGKTLAYLAPIVHLLQMREPRVDRTHGTFEARRRKWLEDYPEATSTDEAVVFDTSIIPWWAWMKRFHLPEAEKLNGRAAMVGFFMAYFVDSLTGVGLVDQMGNFFCKTLLFVAVAGVLLIRKNEDIESLKKLIDETTFYDKQWQATWQDDSTRGPKN